MARTTAVTTGLRYKSLFNDANCISLYQFEGTPTVDSKGSNTLTNAGTTASVSGGKFGNCADFGTANSSKYFTLAGAFSILGSDSCTFSFWTKIQTEPGTNAIFIQFVHFNNTTTDRYINLKYQDASGIKKIIISFSGTTAQYIVTLGTTNWHHIAVVRDVTNSKGLVYLDGVAVITNATLGTGAGGVKNFAIGVDPYAGNFSSSFVDDFAVFNRVLTASEVLSLATGTRNTASARTTVSTLPRLPIGGVFIKDAGFEYGTGSATVVDTFIGNSDVWQMRLSAGVATVSYDNVVYNSALGGLKSIKTVITSDTGQKGFYSVTRLTTATTANLAKYGILVKPSTAYTMTYYKKMTDITGSYIVFDTQEFAAAGGTRTAFTQTNIGSTVIDWTKVTLNFTTAATTNYVTISSYCGTPATAGTFWIDDITLTETTPTVRNPVV